MTTSGFLPSECPNCGRLHKGHDFNNDPGPVQEEVARLTTALKWLARNDANGWIKEKVKETLGRG